MRLRVCTLILLQYVFFTPRFAAQSVRRRYSSHQCSWDLSRLDLPSLDEAGIDELSALQANGLVTSVELVHAFIHRIEEVNNVLHSVSEINPDASLIAHRLDAERAAGKVRGPLHGIPILVKDNIATLDRMNNTAGSFALLGAIVSEEAPVVTKLRDAGAVILGKATMGEWAQMRSSIASSSHGWSAYGGQALGAYYSQQDPSGSSSGSAVAAALGMAVGALATETSGSILLPAEKSNIIGIKPTLGLTSRSMVIPISTRQDSVGLHARTVKDAAIMLSVISGVDKNDNWTLAQPFNRVPNYASACKYQAFHGAKLGVPRNGIDYFLNNSTRAIMSAFEDALQLIAAAGATVHDNANFAAFDLPAFSRNSSLVLDVDFAAGLKDYLSKLAFNPNEIHNLQDIARFTKGDPREQWPDRDIYVWERERDRNLTATSDESRAAYQANLDMAERDGIIGALDSEKLDALIMPTFASFHLPAIAGLPVVTVPLGVFPPGTEVIFNAKGTMVNIAPGIPFGISFIGRKWSEELLIGLAYAFEQRTMSRNKIQPLIRPTFGLSDMVPQPGQSPDLEILQSMDREDGRRQLPLTITKSFTSITGEWSGAFLNLFVSGSSV